MLVVAMPCSAYVCTRTGPSGPSAAWFNRDVVVQRANSSADVGEDEVNEAIERSMRAWQVPCTDVSLRMGAPANDDTVGFDWAAGSGSVGNQNIVVFRRGDGERDGDEWLHQLGALAITTVTYVTSSGELVDADIEINDENVDLSTCDPGAGCTIEVDLQNMLTHEFGHVLGLDHPNIADATMAATSPPGDLEKRSLSPDDSDGLCAIYPAGSSTGECYGVRREEPPEVAIVSSCQQGQAGVLSFCGVMCALLRRRRMGVSCQQ
jgi:hypothetical protein